MASGGGHWIELLRLRPAFEGHDVAYVTVRDSYRSYLDGERLHVVNDATRWDKFGLMRCACRILWIILRERPHIIISTGAAHGYFAFVFAKLLRRRTVWVDSISNAEKISDTAERIGRWADLVLTQWPDLARPDGPRYEGAIL